MPELGNVPMASKDSVIWALADLGYPYVLHRSTERGPAQPPAQPPPYLLRAPAGVYLVSLQVIFDGKECKHDAVLSNLAVEHAPHGKLINNHGKMRPCYVEARKQMARIRRKRRGSSSSATRDAPSRQVFELKKKA
jgi:hypothetical protein